MKKLLALTSAAILFATASFAQQSTPSTATKTKPHHAAHAVVDSTHKKKDGTLDKRFKENKKSGTTAVHKKADGTPDKRYKENKAVKKAS